MNHIYSLEDIQLEDPSLLTIGVFDGMHIGHQTLIQHLVQHAHEQNMLAVALTFFPHPDIVLRGLEGRYYLMTPDQRAEMMIRLGMDYVVTHPFNQDVREIRAADFVDRLLKHLKMKQLWVGSDFALGYKREGNVEYLTEQGQEKGFTVEAIELIMNGAGKTVIRSSQIRDKVLAGELDEVRRWLGRGYSVVGEVVHGEKRGRTIGFPTANVAVWEQQIIPANGVYAGWAKLGNEIFKAVTNIGVRPTFEGDNVTVEAHLLDFDRDIYGQSLEVSFETRLRSEKKFNGIQELISQIHADVESARGYLEENSRD